MYICTRENRPVAIDSNTFCLISYRERENHKLNILVKVRAYVIEIFKSLCGWRQARFYGANVQPEKKYAIMNKLNGTGKRKKQNIIEKSSFNEKS